MKQRTCIDCGSTFWGGNTAKYCLDCKEHRTLAIQRVVKREWHRKHRGKKAKDQLTRDP